MAHWAEIDDNNNVLRVIVTSNDLPDEGEAFVQESYGGTWLKTSYNGNFRKQLACKGGTYDPVRDEFVSRQPIQGWVLDENNDWVAPHPAPAENYVWDQELLDWVEVPMELWDPPTPQE